MWFRSITGSAKATTVGKTRRSKKRPAARREARPCLAALEQLEDRVLLSAVPPTTLAEQSLAAVNAFQKIEYKFADAQADFLKVESALLQYAGNKLSSSTTAYFFKLDSELVKVDGDLVGSPTTDQSAGGLDGVLLADLALPTATQKYLQNVLVPAVGQELALANKLLGQLTNQSSQPEATALGGGPPVDDYYKLNEYKLNGISALTVNFAEIENDLIAADAADLGSALGLRGSPPPGPAGTLLQDMSALAIDASGPGNSGAPTAGGAIAAVDAFMKIENQLIGQQSDLLKLESAFLKGSTISADSWRVHIPPNVTSQQAADYFLKIDADFVQLDDDSIGPPTVSAASAASETAATGGIDGVLLGLGLPAEMLATIENKIVPGIKEARASMLSLEAQLLQQQGQLAPQDKTSNAGDKKGGGDKPIEQLSLNFSTVAAQVIQTDPQGLGPLVPGMLQDMLVTTADEQVSINFGKIHIHYAANAAGEQVLLNFGKLDFPSFDSGATLTLNEASGESTSAERLR